MKGNGFLETFCAFFAALISRWIAAETYAWMPAMADWLLRLYVRFLPGETGERLLEEWRSLLYDTPGNLAKLLRAIDLGRTMFFTKIEVEGIEASKKAEVSINIRIGTPALAVMVSTLVFLEMVTLLPSKNYVKVAGLLVLFALWAQWAYRRARRSRAGDGHSDAIHTPDKP
ncbi:MAG: hypothetical protein AAGB19_02815 [Cyanobacteria bacterium P01_F01_bin.3]